MEEKKVIQFSAPIYLKQSKKIKRGEIKSRLVWDLPRVLKQWVFNFCRLFPRFVSEEVGAEYETLREGYYGIGENGQIERLEVPVIDEETEILKKDIAISVEMHSLGQDELQEHLLRLDSQMLLIQEK